MIQRTLTAESFLQHRADLTDAGQWAELVRGIPVVFQPPDMQHGTTVLNLSKALASHFGGGAPGYACFDLGLKVQRAPDTVLFPAVSLFFEGARFAEADKVFTETVPQMVVEVISTADRRRAASEKICLYQEWGVEIVWQIDCHNRSALVHGPQAEPSRLLETQVLRGDPLLSGFSILVSDLFAEPEWVHRR